MKYNKILLKMSGEALIDQENNISPQILNFYAKEIKSIVDIGCKVGVVLGGGNIFRGLKGTEFSIDRADGDYMGILATIINGIALKSALSNIGLKVKLFTSINISPICEFYNRDKAIELLNEGCVVIFAGGTGSPYFTTDTAATLKAAEIQAEVIMKATKVDGIYTKDPMKYADATKYNQITFDEAIQKNLKVMDITAFAMCKENNIPIIVFDVNKKENIKKIILGENIGTIVKNTI